MARHSSVEAVAQYLKPNPNLQGDQLIIAEACEYLSDSMLNYLNDSPELTVGLRKLLEAKDCFVRASLNLTSE